MTIAPICRTDARVLDERQRKAVDAISRKRMTRMPIKVTIHIVLKFIMKCVVGEVRIFLPDLDTYLLKGKGIV